MKNHRSLPAVTLALSGATINAKGQHWQQLQLQLRVALLAVGQHWPHSGRDLEKPVRKTFGLRRYQNDGDCASPAHFIYFFFFLFLFYYDFLFFSVVFLFFSLSALFCMLHLIGATYVLPVAYAKRGY